MAVNDSQTTTATMETSSPFGMGDDRYCRHCNEIALAYDPSASRARCRSCGELA